jgi:hypothetical protein
MMLLFWNGVAAGAGGYPNAYTDLTWAFTHHIAALRLSSGGTDSTTLAAKDVATVRAAASAPGLANMNVAEAEYLLVNN